MRTTADRIRVLKCVAIAAALGWCAMAYAGGLTPTPKAPAAPATPPKSVFMDEPDKGKDPFFPTSTRRQESLPRMVVPSTNATPETSTLFNLLQLKGISGLPGERLAIINGSTVGVGEVADIRCSGRQILKIRIREIRDQSVVVELVGAGEVRELKLRSNI